MENNQQDLLGNTDLQVDGHAKMQLGETAKWGKFIAIVMFILAGLIIIFGLIAGAALSGTFRRLGGAYDILGGFEGPVLIIVFVFIAAVIALIYYFLYQFSVKVKAAVVTENKQDLGTALKSLKTFFIITTVLAILGLLINIYNTFINKF